MPRVKAFDKEVVLDKAMELFWQKGFNATSYSDLVEHLGINRQSIYDTFGDKQQLYTAALDRYRCNATKALMAEMAQYTSARKLLEVFMRYAVINSVRNQTGGKGCFMVNSTVELGLLEPSVASLIFQNMSDTESFLKEVIERGQAAGEITLKHTAEALASYLFTVLSGLNVSAKLALPQQTYETVIKVAFSALD